jgi:hypothetical protein
LREEIHSACSNNWWFTLLKRKGEGGDRCGVAELGVLFSVYFTANPGAVILDLTLGAHLTEREVCAQKNTAHCKTYLGCDNVAKIAVVHGALVSRRREERGGFLMEKICNLANRLKLLARVGFVEAEQSRDGSVGEAVLPENNLHIKKRLCRCL